jgi:phage regulator Rha-like protein
MARKKSSAGGGAVLPATSIEQRILLIRGQKVMIDADLAEIYGVPTKRLNEQVRRNPQRFPTDFVFQLTAEEYTALRSHFATLKTGRGQHRKYLPYAFTEHGAIMAANVLRSEQAIEVSVYVVRAFVRLREMIASNKELACKLDALEKKLATHDQAITGILTTLRQMMNPPAPKRRGIGFVIDED